MRVAILSTAPVASYGWGRYTRDLITALSAQGIEIVFLTSFDASPKTDLSVVAYHRTLPPLTPAPRLSSLRLLAAIPTVHRLTADCDIVHIVAEPYALAALTARRCVVTAHGTYVVSTSARPIAGAFYRRIYRRSPLICVSSYTEQQVQAALPGVKTFVIPNGVNADRYASPDKATKPEKRGPTILAVGQLKPRKGYHVLVEAICQVREAVPNVQVICMGDTSDTIYHNTLLAQIKEAGLSESVHLLGRVPDDVLLGWYHAADVFALPSVNIDGRFEGFGLVYLEASAAGLPVVGTMGCGAEDAIRDGETGLLVPQNDPTATARALIKLLRDADLRSKMGAAGAAYAQQHTWARVAERVRALYGSVTNDR